MDLKKTDKDVTDKLEQLHSVIDSLQETVKGIHSGYNKHAEENAIKMQKKFEKLSKVIGRLGTQKNELYAENKKLRQEKTTLINKIATLERVLGEQAELIENSGVEAWLRKTATDLKSFLEDSGLEHFASPRFSPLIAGLVAYGVITVPLAGTTLFLLRFVKQLTILKVVMALNLFDLGYVMTMLISGALLLGDPIEGLRHISEVNFVFIQIVLAVVFWLTCIFITWGIILHRTCPSVWKYLLLELTLRITIALDYAGKVWKPAMDREDVGIALSGVRYLIYLLSSLAAVKFTLAANTRTVAVAKKLEGEHGDLEGALLPVMRSSLQSHQGETQSTQCSHAIGFTSLS